MKLLIDSCTFLWIAAEPKRVSRRASELFQNPENEAYLSTISTWELTIKISLGRLELPSDPNSYIPQLRTKLGIETLPLDEQSCFHLTRLPLLHRDPFDRMLICQAIEHGMTILTPDELINQYPAKTAW